jgi:hypothetical protein
MQNEPGLEAEEQSITAIDPFSGYGFLTRQALGLVDIAESLAWISKYAPTFWGTRIHPRWPLFPDITGMPCLN